MKKKYEIPLILIVIITPFVLYGLHSVKKVEVTIADGKVIVGDGSIYVDGPQYAIVTFTEHVFELCTYDYTRGYDGNFGDRYIFVDFINARWKDGNLTDIHPKIPSMRYHGSIAFGIDYADMLMMEVDERLEPDWLGIGLLDRGPTHDGVCVCHRNRWVEEFNDSNPTSSLYNEGHAYFEREGQDVYVLDVDAWFKANEYSHEEPGELILISDVTYYIRLSFRIILTLKGLI